MKIVIINGPNLNLLGKRETGIYGNRSFEDFFSELKNRFPAHEFSSYQSNVEGEIINKLHGCGMKGNADSADAIIINPGGYSHTSVAIADAIRSIEVPVVEAHISNIHAREEFRKQSITGSACLGVITGFGFHSYILAADYFISNHHK